VKSFDAANQLAAECFGGETTSKTYDSSTDKFMDLSVEKSNSAYMLFYEKKNTKSKTSTKDKLDSVQKIHDENHTSSEQDYDDLFKLIWNENMKFINDRHIFEHGYFNFVWQICEYVPRSFMNRKNSLMEMIANQTDNVSEASLANAVELALAAKSSILLAFKLGVSFLFETYVHARDKPNMVQWIELMLTLLSSNKEASIWFVEFLSDSTQNAMQWCVKIFLKCPNSAIRQMFQRLLIHTVTLAYKEDKKCVENFIDTFLELIESRNSNQGKNKRQDNNNAHNHNQSGQRNSKDQAMTSSINKFNIRHMSEYFSFLYEFARIGQEECLMLIRANAISKCATFYLHNRRPDNTRAKNTQKNGVKKNANSRNKQSERRKGDTIESKRIDQKFKKKGSYYCRYLIFILIFWIKLKTR
jgi:ubiquitin carboxyl-terminal hydrolase 34